METPDTPVTSNASPDMDEVMREVALAEDMLRWGDKMRDTSLCLIVLARHLNYRERVLCELERRYFQANSDVGRLRDALLDCLDALNNEGWAAERARSVLAKLDGGK